jgi:hypothetical protein
MRLKEALERHLAPVKENLRKMNNPDKHSLREIRDELTNVVIDVAETLRLYSEKFDKYYEKHKPFSHGNEEKDIEDFMSLVRDSFITGNYSLLKRWAVDYPARNPAVLKQPLSYYVKNFQDDLEDWVSVAAEEGWHPESKAYWEYLVAELSAKMSQSTVADFVP